MPGLHTFRVREEELELPARFRIIEPIGQGAFGYVFSGTEEVAPGLVRKIAVKKIKNITKTEATALRVLQELSIMRHVKHENVLGLQHVLTSPKGSLKDLYIVTCLMETDLGSVIKSNQEISHMQAKLIFLQVLRGLEHMHALGTIHRDIKPRNILINSNCDVKICDFGLSTLDSLNRSQRTAYVCTRWYRAPEVLLGDRKYDNKVDVFSSGCVLAEMIGRRPLLPGSSNDHQLELYIKRFGRLPAWASPGRQTPTDGVSGDLEDFMVGSKSLLVNEEGIAFIRYLCSPNAEDRPSMSLALEHKWFGNLRLLSMASPPTNPLLSALPIYRDEKLPLKEFVRKEIKKINEDLAGARYSDGMQQDILSDGDETPSTGCTIFKFT